MMKSGQSISITRVAQQTLLASLACILVITGGMDGLTTFQKFFINVILIALVGLGWLGYYIWRREQFPATVLDIPLLVWLAAILMASIVSENPRRSMEPAIYYLVCVLVFYLMVAQERSGKSLENWLSLTLAASTIPFLFGFIELAYWYGTWLSIGGLEQLIPPATIRIQGTLGHANSLAAYLNLLLPLAVVRLIASPSRSRRALLAIWCGIALVMIYFTSSRGGWLGTATAMSTLALMLSLDQWDHMKHAWFWLRSHPLTSLGILLILLLFAGVAGILLMRQVQHPSHPTADPRGYIWSVAWAMFLSRPLLGTGPGTFGTYFMHSYSIPPVILLPHAHNFLLNLLGETGLLGAGSALFLGIMLIWSAFKRWRMEPPGKRMVLAGSLAALAGLGVHSQFDVVQVSPIVNLITAAIIAQLIAPITLKKHPRQIPGSILLVTGWLLATSLWLWALWGYTAFERGLDAAGKRDWPAAAYWMDMAVRRDPGLAFYHFQTGISHARLALNDNFQVRDRQQLEYALAAYESGLQIDDDYSLDWASLGELRWAGGDRLGGIAALERAVSLAPGSPDLNLLLGKMYEDSGQVERAFEQYRTSLDLQPALAKSSYFQQSSIRREALSGFSHPETDPGWLALETGEYAQAEEIFRSQLGLNNATSYLGLGLSLLGAANVVDAEKALRTAEFIDPGNLEVMEALEKLYERTGQVKKAVSAMNATHGLNSLKDIQYNYFLSYHRFGLGKELILTMACEFCFKPR